MSEDFLDTLGTIQFNCVASGADSVFSLLFFLSKIFFSFVLCALHKAKESLAAFHLSSCRVCSLCNFVICLFSTILTFPRF